MRHFGLIFASAAAGLMLVAAPQGASAQQGGGWWEWALPALLEARAERGGDTARRDRSLPDIVLGRDDRARNDRGRQGSARAGDARDARGARGGPPFCQNGEGHPVHGRQWCRDKGFGTGGGVLDTRWETRTWEDVILRAPRGTDRRQGTLDRGGLIDVLGDVIYGRIATEGNRAGAREPLTGRWLTTERGARVLQIRSGSVPVAELTDLDGNGRADSVLVRGK
jgi:hypothetical protein